MSGATPKRSLRISNDEWAQIQADAERAGKERTEYLLDCWRLARDPSRKLPRLYVAAGLEEIRQDLELVVKRSIKRIEKITR